MTAARFSGGVPATILAALIGTVGSSAWCQALDPAPYLHTHEHHQLKSGQAKQGLKMEPQPVSKAIPVLRPHHVGLSRHAAHPASAVTPAPKAGVEAAKPPPPKTAPPPPPNIGPSTGLPLPRYASLKSDDVNMRSGPGERYPVLWNYQRRDLPVKIEHEFDIWRQVEDMDGVKGWIQQGFLIGHRSFIITGTQDRTLRAQAAETADPVAILKPGIVGRIKSCEAGQDWCQVQVQDYRGWLKRADFWGVDTSETITP